MAKQRQIPFLTAKKLRDGTTAYYWEPSATRKKQGWQSQSLGTDKRAAIKAALKINDDLAEWLAGTAGAPTAATVEPPRLIRFSGLVARYKAHDAYTGLRPTSRDSYDTALRFLTAWAKDGELPIAHITPEMVDVLRDALVQGSSSFRASSILRVLRLIMGWAKRQRLIDTNPAAECNIPTPPSRNTLISYDALTALIAAANARQWHDMALLIELAWWTAQRQADICDLSAIMWREHHHIDARDAAILAGPDGRCMGFRLQQKKTGVWVDAFAPPHLHDAITARLRGGYLFTFPGADTEKARLRHLQRQWAAVAKNALEKAQADGAILLSDDLTGIQFRDLRRSALTFYADAGVEALYITNLSGHAVLGTKSILDTYIKTQPTRSAACLAQGLRHLARLQEQKEARG